MIAANADILPAAVEALALKDEQITTKGVVRKTVMAELVPGRASTSLPSVFLPEEAKIRDAKADAVIEYAQTIKDWPLLMQAVEAKLEDQREFVRWWDEKVGVRQSPGKGGIKSNAGLRSMSREQAESITGITQQQVSKWRKRLKEPEKYREMLYGAAYRKAMAGAGETNQHHRTQFTGENEWYTPAEYVEAARSFRPT